MSKSSGSQIVLPLEPSGKHLKFPAQEHPITIKPELLEVDSDIYSFKNSWADWNVQLRLRTCAVDDVS